MATEQEKNKTTFVYQSQMNQLTRKQRDFVQFLPLRRHILLQTAPPIGNLIVANKTV